MHRGSSKGRRGRTRRPETLPLSASPVLTIHLEIARAGASEVHRLRLPRGTLVRQALRTVGQAAEGAAVLRDGVPVPLDLPLDRNERFTVIPTFSGG